MRNPGMIFETDKGKFAIAYNREQELAFAKASKMYVHLFHDRELTKPIMSDRTGQPMKTLISAKLLIKHIGFVD